MSDAELVPCSHCEERVPTDDLNEFGHCPECEKLECEECHGVEECERGCECEECRQACFEDTCIASMDTYDD